MQEEKATEALPDSETSVTNDNSADNSPAIVSSEPENKEPISLQSDAKEKAQHQHQHKEENDEEKEVSDLARSRKSDLIAGRYLIQLNQLLTDYCSDFAQAYSVIDKSEKDETSSYCLIYNEGAPIRLHVINALKSISNQHIITPLASEICHISSLDQYRFVVVLNKPKGQTLASFIESNGPSSEEFIAKTLILPLASALDALDGLDVMHGCVNPNTIFIDPSTRFVTLGECVSTTSGYSQHEPYEIVGRSVTSALGKGEGNVSADYYALGVIALFAQLGRAPLEGVDEDTILISKLTNGTFNTLLKNADLSPSLTDLYRGLLNDKDIMRWSASQLKDWAKGKYFNLVRIPPPVEATRSISFNEVQYFNRQALAHALFREWKIAKKFLREDKLTKWIEGSVGNPELAAQLRQVQKITSVGRLVTGIFDLDDELVARSIYLLNPTGPFQFKNISINPNAFGNMIAYEFSKKRLEASQTIAFAMANRFFGYLETVTEREEQDEKLLWHLRNSIEFIGKTNLGFAIERCLYELNPGLPCQSPMVSSAFPANSRQLLEALDELCKKNSEVYPMDRHIAAFIASRINLNNDIRIKGLIDHPKMSNNRHIQATALLMQAQKESGIKALKGLASVMAQHLHSLVDSIHGKAYKKELTDNINKVANEGSLISLYRVISDPQILIADQRGFDEAKRQYMQLETQLCKLKGKNTAANLGYYYGLRLAVVVAYALCGMEFFFLVVR